MGTVHEMSEAPSDRLRVVPSYMFVRGPMRVKALS